MTRISHPTLSQRHGVEGDSNIARDSTRTKDQRVDVSGFNVPHHVGTTKSQRATAGVGGLSHPTSTALQDGGQAPGTSSVEANQATALKDHPQAPVHPHMRSQTSYEHAFNFGRHTVAHDENAAGRVLGNSVLSGSTALPSKTRSK